MCYCVLSECLMTTSLYGSYREKSSEFFNDVPFPGKVSESFFHLIFLESNENLLPHFPPFSSEQSATTQGLMQQPENLIE